MTANQQQPGQNQLQLRKKIIVKFERANTTKNKVNNNTETGTITTFPTIVVNTSF